MLQFCAQPLHAFATQQLFPRIDLDCCLWYGTKSVATEGLKRQKEMMIRIDEVLLIEQPNTFSEQEGLPTSFVDANTHTIHSSCWPFVQKNGAETGDDSARLLQPFRLCFFPLHFVQTRYADVFEDVLDIWLCRQTTMPVPFDSNKPSFSIACLRKLRVGTFQANLPRHPYPFVLQSVRQEQVTKKQPRIADNSTSQCLSS